MGLWTELLVLQAMIGYSFVIANDLIGFYNIRDLNNMKGDLVFVKAHKLFGRIESIFFYVIMIQCIWMMVIMDITNPIFYDLNGTPGIHAMIGGIIAFCLFTFKFVIATFKKDIIYKYGKYIGPIGFLAWSISYFTSMIDYYFFLIPTGHDTPIFLPDNFWFALIFSLAIGTAIFLMVLVRRGSVSKEKRFSNHQIAFILHGITFGYERAAKELLGTPALLKYVVPKTYEFLDKMMEMFGVDIKKLERLNLNDAMEEFMKVSAKIGMAEKIKIKWESDKTFTIESVNCSTAKVRSVMSKEELTNAICPWALMAAAIAGRILKKDLSIEPSDFNEIGAKTRLIIQD